MTSPDGETHVEPSFIGWLAMARLMVPSTRPRGGSQPLLRFDGLCAARRKRPVAWPGCHLQMLGVTAASSAALDSLPPNA
jgi:hypothetical protein